MRNYECRFGADAHRFEPERCCGDEAPSKNGSSVTWKEYVVIGLQLAYISRAPTEWAKWLWGMYTTCRRRTGGFDTRMKTVRSLIAAK